MKIVFFLDQTQSSRGLVEDPTMSREVDVVVVGGGPGGYTAAFRAADLGHKVILVEAREQLGGVCLHEGCIPSKALLHVADLMERIRSADQMGIRVGVPHVKLDQLRAWKSSVISKLTSGVADLASLRGVEVVLGRARLQSSKTLVVEGDGVEEISFTHAILATGSRPVGLPGMPDNCSRLLDSTRALQLERIPETLLVIGGGYIGLELGTVYAAMGSRVTVVEMTDRLLQGVDRDLVRPLERRIRALFESAHLQSRVIDVREKGDGLEVDFEGTSNMSSCVFDQVLVSVGRRPNSEGLGLDCTQVIVDEQGFIETDSQCRTNDPALFAIGDVTRQPMLAHKAMREAKVAAEVINGQDSTYDPKAVPAVVFTDPEVAWCGLTETEARDSGQKVRIVRFPWAASGRAMSLERTEGLTKMILDSESGQVLGVGIVGVNAGELIAEAVVAVEMSALAEDLALSIHPHPTLSETLGEAAESFMGQTTHLFRKERIPR